MFRPTWPYSDKTKKFKKFLGRGGVNCNIKFYKKKRSHLYIVQKFMSKHVVNAVLKFIYFSMHTGV